MSFLECLSAAFTLIGCGVWFWIGTKVAADSIFGYYPQSYGAIGYLSTIAIVFVAAILLALQTVWLSTLFLVIVFLAKKHVDGMRGPNGWYYNNTRPPEKDE